MDNKGQAEAVFRILIDSVIGIVILVIIITALGYFQSQNIEQSVSAFNHLAQSATSSPDGQVISSDNLTFSEGYLVDSDTMQEVTGVSKQCLSFQSGYNSAAVSSDGKQINFSKTLTTKVYAQCSPSSGASTCNPKVEPTDLSQCCFTCIFSFGKQLN